LNLIEDKTFGILSIIDDEINIPRANDSTLLRKLMNAYILQTPPNTDQAIAAGRFSTVALPSSSQEVFKISHYAGW
jgi:myosin heavy subunit